jgi:hypothetical protein
MGVSSDCRFRSKQLVNGDRQGANAPAGGVEYSVGDGGRNTKDPDLADSLDADGVQPTDPAVAASEAARMASPYRRLWLRVRFIRTPCVRDRAIPSELEDAGDCTTVLVEPVRRVGNDVRLGGHRLDAKSTIDTMVHSRYDFQFGFAFIPKLIRQPD